MPLYQNFSDESATVWVWKHDEDEELNPDILLEPENYEKVTHYHPKKVAEVLMVRKMLKQLLPEHKILYKENGEPYLEPADKEISISHSFPLAAIAISDKKVGIDLERIKDKIVKIRHKFTLHESSFIEASEEKEYLTAIWCVKESLYKLHHSKFWSLKKNYEVETFHLQDLENVRCKVYDDTFSDYFWAQLKRFDDFFFSIVVES
ncbi:4'-phosphopantetheinyl transferase family protein [Elizabethkingia meningoseptica]|uniref:4'-phosphopantetheinyl transferase family protein n=1 Tax=Elizabethkingia meningoseptica TaxID=238 RepID=UPI0020122573|nr:4'-phosphopantetheinyl transferase superfamily protein [Elizabethkingia meningoseptica]MCL1674808.1 4'-phosphopantetheinyl transferase superfamily protein [Elizabethkingia meningoseptica]MCL1685824.1 4'-phosphopantetheinyl transferase superfamily protein [Elizabethkingia meningoseptica]